MTIALVDEGGAQGGREAPVRAGVARDRAAVRVRERDAAAREAALDGEARRRRAERRGVEGRVAELAQFVGRRHGAAQFRSPSAPLPWLEAVDAKQSRSPPARSPR